MSFQNSSTKWEKVKRHWKERKKLLELWVRINLAYHKSQGEHRPGDGAGGDARRLVGSVIGSVGAKREAAPSLAQGCSSLELQLRMPSFRTWECAFFSHSLIFFSTSSIQLYFLFCPLSLYVFAYRIHFWVRGGGDRWPDVRMIDCSDDRLAPAVSLNSKRARGVPKSNMNPQTIEKRIQKTGRKWKEKQ